MTLLRTLTGGGRILDRDSIWLTEKDSDGSTSLYPLTSFHPPPRPDDNIFRKYLLGKYGGLPRVFPGHLARVVEETMADEDGLAVKETLTRPPGAQARRRGARETAAPYRQSSR